MPRTLIIITAITIFLFNLPASAEDAAASDTTAWITLPEAQKIALANNLEIKAAAEGLIAAQFGVKAANALDLFSLTAAGASTKSGPEITQDFPGVGTVVISPSNFIHTLSLTLSQPIFTFGLNRNMKKISEYNLGVAQSEYDTKLDEIQYLVESSYYDLIYLQLLLDVQEQNLDRASNDKHIAELRFDAGQVAKFEVIRADVAVKNAEESLIGTRKALNMAELAWMKVLSVDEFLAPVTINPDDVEGVPLEITLEEAKVTAIETRPELKGLRLSIGLAEAGARLKTLRPDLRFISSYNFSSSNSAFSSDENYRFIFNLNLPLYDGGKANAEFDQGMHQAEQLRLQLDDIEEGISIEVADAYYAIQEALERMDATSATLALAEEAKRMAEIGYKEGVVTLQDVLSAEVELSGAQANRIGAVYDYLKSLAALRKAMGVDVISQAEIS